MITTQQEGMRRRSVPGQTSPTAAIHITAAIGPTPSPGLARLNAMIEDALRSWRISIYWNAHDTRGGCRLLVTQSLTGVPGAAGAANAVHVVGCGAREVVVDDCVDANKVHATSDEVRGDEHPRLASTVQHTRVAHVRGTAEAGVKGGHGTRGSKASDCKPVTACPQEPRFPCTKSAH